MKVAIISDIHANLEAFQTVLTYLQAENISEIICLGDIIGYGPRPNECVGLVQTHCQTCLMGNHEHGVLGLTDVHYFNQYAQDALLWTRRHLFQYHKAYLGNLPYSFAAGDALFVHSTPLQPEEWHYIFTAEEARQNLQRITHRLVFVGHSHIPMIFSYRSGAIGTGRVQLNLEEDRYIVNVGSVGQPRDGNPRACFVIFDRDAHALEYIRLEYPVEKTHREILENHLPPFLAMRLLTGQ